MDFAGVRTSTAGLGSVTGVAASTVTAGQAQVTIGGITVVCNVARGITLAVGDTVLVHRQGSARWVTSVLFAAAPAVVTDTDAAPEPKPTLTTGTLVVSPVETRSWRDGKWRTDTDDTLQGSYGGYGTSTGCAFYGTAPRSLAGAVVTAATLRVRRIRAGVFAAQASTLRLVTQATRPGGAPTLTLSTTGPSLAVGATANAHPVPAAWVQSMVDGTAGGLAVYDADGSPYIRYAGRGSWSPAWTLTIAWQRST